MGKKSKPHITRMQAEGTTAEKNAERKEAYEKAKALAQKMPTFGPDKLVYVRNVTIQALHEEIDKEAFKEFVKMTNSYYEVETCFPRAQLLAEKPQTPRKSGSPQKP